VLIRMRAFIFSLMLVIGISAIPPFVTIILFYLRVLRKSGALHNSRLANSGVLPHFHGFFFARMAELVDALDSKFFH
jgi:hypothetical protein